MTSLDETDLPGFLREYGDFTAHLETHFDGLGNAERGDAFLDFALRLLPFADEWSGVGEPKKSPKKSHDRGVDFEAKADDGSFVVFGQSKLRLNRVEDLDGVVSKFQAFETDYLASATPRLFPKVQDARPPVRFCIVTSSRLSGIIDLYTQKHLASVKVFEEWRASGRVILIDGPRALTLLRALYRKSFVVPTTLTLPIMAPPIRQAGVYISIVSARDLRLLYEIHGQSLFFENVRDFLGFSTAGPESVEQGVNDDIRVTLNEEPERMLERNNGITLKAEAVEVVDDGRALRLSNSGIVNGCQTTMCIVHAGEKADVAVVPVKVVTSTDPWGVAKAANYQNHVSRIELELARFLRPQLMRRLAVTLGYGTDRTQAANVADVMSSIYQARVSYDSVRCLCVGFFSRSPSNLFASNYNKLKTAAMDEILTGGHRDQIMQVLLDLLRSMDVAAEKLRTTYGDESYVKLIQRLHDPKNFRYRCFVAILGASLVVGDSLEGDPPAGVTETQRLLRVFSRLDFVLLSHREYFTRAVELGFEKVADRFLNVDVKEDAELRQRAYKEVADVEFKRLYQAAKLRMDGDHLVQQYRREHPDVLQFPAPSDSVALPPGAVR